MHRVTFLIDVNRYLGMPISDEVQPKRQLNMSDDSSEIDTLLILGSGAGSSATVTMTSEVPIRKHGKGG